MIVCLVRSEPKEWWYTKSARLLSVHLPFPLLGKIVGLIQLSSFLVGIGLPCLKLKQTSLPRVVTQQSAFLEYWIDFPSYCWDARLAFLELERSHLAQVVTNWWQTGDKLVTNWWHMTQLSRVLPCKFACTTDDKLVTVSLLVTVTRTNIERT